MTKKQKDKILNAVTERIGQHFNTEECIEQAGLTNKEVAWAKKHLDWKVYEVKS